MFQFILLRWVLRFFIWFLFLCESPGWTLRLIATHPDLSVWTGFLGTSSLCLLAILFAQGALLSAHSPVESCTDGQTLVSFKMEAAGLVVFFMFFIVSPLLVSLPTFARAKRRGLQEYGALRPAATSRSSGKVD